MHITVYFKVSFLICACDSTGSSYPTPHNSLAGPIPFLLLFISSFSPSSSLTLSSSLIVSHLLLVHKMSSSIPGPVALPASPYPLDTYWGRVRHSLDICDPRTLFTSNAQLSQHVNLISQYKNGITTEITPELWRAKKVVDATLHPDTGEKVLLPFRMSAFVFSNLIVTVGMLTPNMSVGLIESSFLTIC